MLCLSWLPEERQENISKVKYFLMSIFHAAESQPGAGKLPADPGLNLTSTVSSVPELISLLLLLQSSWNKLWGWPDSSSLAAQSCPLGSPTVPPWTVVSWQG